MAETNMVLGISSLIFQYDCRNSIWVVEAIQEGNRAPDFF